MASVSEARQFDVVVAGAGLTGSAAACLFARQGLRVALVESRSFEMRDESPADGRVSALSPASAALFEALGVWRALPPQRVSCYRAMKVWDDNSAARISFDADDLGIPCLGYIVENRALVGAMGEKLRQNYQVTLLGETDITAIAPIAEVDGGARVTLSTAERIDARLLVGADGADSRVRALSGMNARREDFGQDAITATVSTTRDHEATARQCFLEGGPAAMLPLADGRCSLVWSCARAQADELMRLPTPDFCARLQPLFADDLGDITACGRRRRFALAQRHADRYIAASTALIGDAAHTTHPLAGLGANLGLVDAAALAEAVEWAQQQRKAIGKHSILRRYERRRQGDNAIALALMKTMNTLFTTPHPAARALRATAMNLTHTLPPLKTTLAKFATGQYGDMPAVCRGEVGG